MITQGQIVKVLGQDYYVLEGNPILLHSSPFKETTEIVWLKEFPETLVLKKVYKGDSDVAV